MNIIEIENLEYRYPDGRTALQGINLTVVRGSFVVLTGGNGAGKSTLLKHCNGLLEPLKGTIRIGGQPLANDVLHARRMVGMVFQDADSQIVGETVWDDVAFGPENLNWPQVRIRQSVERSLQLVGLDNMADRSPHLLSGGEKRRLAIAGILAMEPEVIVLDEPFANLDYDGIRQVLTHIVSLHGLGITIIICVHDLEKVLAHADRLVVMQNGRVVVDGPPREAVLAVEQHGVRMPAVVKLGGWVESWLR